MRLSPFAVAPAALAILLAGAASARDGGVTDGGVTDGGVIDAGASVAQETDADAPVDRALETRLRGIYAQIEAMSEVEAAVSYGVVTLTGSVPSDRSGDKAVALAGKLDGVVYVVDEIKRPTQVADRLNPVQERFEGWLARLVALAPLLAIAVAVLLLFLMAGRFIAGLDFIFTRLVDKPIMRDLWRRIVRTIFVVVGAILALEILDATTLVGTVLGAAGVFGLVLGFAFRDIAENYLASILLAGRRPFSVGDTVEINGYTGKVMRLTMRETVLMTFEGNHLSLPNASVFKASVLNFTRNPHRRLDFVVGAGVDEDLVEAQELGIRTLAATPGVVADPAPFARIEELGDSNVAIRFFAWVDQNDADFLKVRSVAIRRVKTALDDAGIEMPEPIYRVHMRQAAPPPAERPSAEVAAADEDVSPDHSIDEQIALHEDEDHNLLERETLPGSDEP